MYHIDLFDLTENMHKIIYDWMKKEAELVQKYICVMDSKYNIQFLGRKCEIFGVWKIFLCVHLFRDASSGLWTLEKEILFPISKVKSKKFGCCCCWEFVDKI